MAVFWARRRTVNRRFQFQPGAAATIALSRLVPFCIAAFAETENKTGRIRGTIFAADSDGDQLAVPGAQVKLSGSGSFETQAMEKFE
jgi:hypothetical protein